MLGIINVALSAAIVNFGVADTVPVAPLAERVRVGAYVHLEGRPYQDPLAEADLRIFEQSVGHLDVIHYFFSWGRAFNESINGNVDGRDLMLSMKPDGDLVAAIDGGRQDDYIDAFARDARAYGREVYLRFGHEMNGHWMSYSAGADGGPHADTFVSAWRHLVDRFRANGATNVKFIWSPNESDFPNVAGNHMEDYWPGSDYVDILGFDAYNWSDAEPRRGDGQARTFEQIVEQPYERLAQLDPDKEIWLCEFGTTEPDKAAWIRAMFDSTRFPRLKGLIYFSENDQRDVQRDWRLDSSTAAAQAWYKGTMPRGAARGQ